MAEKESLQRSRLFEKVSDYPKTSSLTAMSFGLIASGLLFLNDRRKKEASIRRQQQEKAKMHSDFLDIMEMSQYVYSNVGNKEKNDMLVLPRHIHSFDPTKVIYSRPK